MTDTGYDPYNSSTRLPALIDFTPAHLDNTMTRALTDAERASIAAAKQAFLRGDIQQREVAPGVFQLARAS